MQIPRTAINAALGDPKLDVMNFLNEIALRHPQAISFAPGRPREEHFDVLGSLEHVRTWAAHRAREQGTALAQEFDALGQYGRTNGRIGALVAHMMRIDEQVHVEAGDIVVTVGCQEAMCLALLTLCGNPGDVALVADPAYIGMAGAARLLGIELAAVATDDGGIVAADLDRVVADLRREGRQPRVLYCSPDAANPTGVTMPPASRRALVAQTRRLGLVVLEDHAYSCFQYEDDRALPLKSEPDSGHVIYLGSFSKSVYPGLRLGYLATDLRVPDDQGLPVRLADEMSKAKSLLSVNTSPLCEAVVGGLLLSHGGSLRGFTAPRREALKQARDAMLAALARHFPRDEAWSAGVAWSAPAGGFFLTLRLPFAVGDADLSESAQHYDVLWTPMSYFCIGHDRAQEVRLSFSYATHDQIDAGIASFARLVRARIAAGAR